MKRFWKTAVDQTGTPNFQLWGKDISDTLALIGLVKVATAGEIDWTTVTRPSSGVAGFEIWRFNDAMQATAPIYIRLEYGVIGSTSINAWFTVGTSVSGAGVLGGVTSDPQVAWRDLRPPATEVRDNYACAVSGTVWMCRHMKPTTAGTDAAMFFAVVRTCDADGLPNGEGCAVYGSGSGTGSGGPTVTVQVLRFSAPAGKQQLVPTPSTAYIPQAIAASTVGGVPQVFLLFICVPKMRAHATMGLMVFAESPPGIETEVALVGTTLRRVVSLGVTGPAATPGVGGSGIGSLVLVWE